MIGGSSGELALIFLLCLLVFGPERLPSLARNLGKLLRRSRLLVQSTWNQLEEEIDREEKASRQRAAADALGHQLGAPTTDAPGAESVDGSGRGKPRQNLAP